MTRRTFLRLASGVVIAATVTDSVGEVASFFDEELKVYRAQVCLLSFGGGITTLLSIEHLSIGDMVTSNGDGYIRRQASAADEGSIIGYAVAMEEEWAT